MVKPPPYNAVCRINSGERRRGEGEYTLDKSGRRGEDVTIVWISGKRYIQWVTGRVWREDLRFRMSKSIIVAMKLKYIHKKRKIKNRTKEKEGGGEGRSERSTGDTILWPPRFFALSTNAFQAVRFQDPPIMKLKINPIYLLLPLPLSPPICSHLPLLLTWFVSWKIDRGSIAKESIILVDHSVPPGPPAWTCTVPNFCVAWFN